MNKKIILLIAILSLLSLAVFVSAIMVKVSDEHELYDLYTIKVKLNKGWNLVNVGGDLLENSEIQEQDILAIYNYNPFTKKYVRLHPDEETLVYPCDPDCSIEEKLKFNINVGAQPSWLYSNKEGFFEAEEIPAKKLDNRDLSMGWNFVTITPEMVGKTIADIKGNCNIEKAYAWDIATQDWDDDLMNNNWEFREGSIVEPGRGIVVKSANYCSLKINGGNSILSPPTIPN